jgi:hypothetical protein
VSRTTSDALSVVLAVVIGIAGSILIAHFAACESDEAFCSISK